MDKELNVVFIIIGQNEASDEKDKRITNGESSHLMIAKTFSLCPSLQMRYVSRGRSRQSIEGLIIGSR